MKALIGSVMVLSIIGCSSPTMQEALQSCYSAQCANTTPAEQKSACDLLEDFALSGNSQTQACKEYQASVYLNCAAQNCSSTSASYIQCVIDTMIYKPSNCTY